MSSVALQACMLILLRLVQLVADGCKSLCTKSCGFFTTHDFPDSPLHDLPILHRATITPRMRPVMKQKHPPNGTDVHHVSGSLASVSMCVYAYMHLHVLPTQAYDQAVTYQSGKPRLQGYPLHPTHQPQSRRSRSRGWDVMPLGSLAAHTANAAHVIPGQTPRAPSPTPAAPPAAAAAVDVTPSSHPADPCPCTTDLGSQGTSKGVCPQSEASFRAAQPVPQAMRPPLQDTGHTQPSTVGRGEVERCSDGRGDARADPGWVLPGEDAGRERGSGLERGSGQEGGRGEEEAGDRRKGGRRSAGSRGGSRDRSRDRSGYMKRSRHRDRSGSRDRNARGRSRRERCRSWGRSRQGQEIQGGCAGYASRGAQSYHQPSCDVRNERGMTGSQWREIGMEASEEEEGGRWHMVVDPTEAMRS